MADGPAVDVVHEYETHLLEKNRRDAALAPQRLREDVELDLIEVVDDDGREVVAIDSGAPISVRARIDARRASRPARVTVAVVRAADEIRCCAVSLPSGAIEPGTEPDTISVRFPSLPLTRGDYGIVVTAEDPDDGTLLGRRTRLPAFRIRGDRFEVGIMRLDHEWTTGAVS
jgi:hypothetical protein